MKNTPEEQPVDADAIAAEFGIAPWTARKHARNGVIPGFKLGGQWRFYPSVVREHLTSKPKGDWKSPRQRRSRAA